MKKYGYKHDPSKFADNRPTVILAVSRGHNASTCLTVDGEIVFYLEEERLSRKKYDGCPLAGIIKAIEYVDHIDHFMICHTHRQGPITDWTHTDIYQGLVEKLLKNSKVDVPKFHFIDTVHHQMHAAVAFLNSGFEDAACVIADGAGSFLMSDMYQGVGFEFETVFTAEYPVKFDTWYKHVGLDSAYAMRQTNQNVFITEHPGIVKAYEAVTSYCGWSSIDAGKTMGLSPYGKPNPECPPILDEQGWVNRNLFIPNYPNGAHINIHRYPFLVNDITDRQQEIADILAREKEYEDRKRALAERGEVESNIDNHLNEFAMKDRTWSQSQMDLAYAVQEASEVYMMRLIEQAANATGKKNIVVCGGYGLNCVANYKYWKKFPDLNIYVEPISHDGGIAIGACKLKWAEINGFTEPYEPQKSIYYGPQYDIDTYIPDVEVANIRYQRDIEIVDTSVDEVAQMIRDGNIVTIFQGRSEGGPRALGNRSILFDPTIKDGKDIVNRIKKREFFRPFACSIKKEFVHEWFDLAGREETPHMMYAVKCHSGVDEKIPSVIHIDNTCRIQTVTPEDNTNYYNLIDAFEKLSGTPILFNTSFNLGGEPLVETIDDAVRTLATSDINYMYLPEIQKLVKVEFNVNSEEKVSDETE